jgi:hypothetical protein
MTAKHVWVTVALVLGSIVPTMAGSASGSLSAQDYADIQQLYTTYGHGFDSKADDGQMYVGVFTEDGTFEDQYDTVSAGHAGLLAKYGHTQTGRPNPISNSHSMWNVVIEPASWGAIGRAYKSGGVTFSADGKPVSSGVPGMYYDVLVKGPAGWRFKQRIFRQEFGRPAQPRGNSRPVPTP